MSPTCLVQQGRFELLGLPASPELIVLARPPSLIRSAGDFGQIPLYFISQHCFGDLPRHFLDISGIACVLQAMIAMAMHHYTRRSLQCACGCCFDGNVLKVLHSKDLS